MKCIRSCGELAIEPRRKGPLFRAVCRAAPTLDYMANGMADPFWGTNEMEAKELAHHNYTYSRSFELPESFLAAAHVDLVAQGLDTLCTITVNGTVLGKTDNINRLWRLDAKPLLKPGQNTIAIQIEDPYPYIAARQAKEAAAPAAWRTERGRHICAKPPATSGGTGVPHCRRQD